MVTPVYAEAAEKMAGKVRFEQVNSNEHSSIAVQCKATCTPTVIVYINGKKADRIVEILSNDALIDRISLRSRQISSITSAL